MCLHIHHRFAPVAMAGLLLLLAAGCGVNPDDNGNDPDLTPDPAAEQIAREIEEADIVKVVDGFLYIANPFTGLRIIDVQNIDNPIIGGRVQLAGQAKELLVVGDYVLIITQSERFTCAGQPVGQDADDLAMLEALTNPDFLGARLWLVDVSDINNPVDAFHHDFGGRVIATRRVGEVIYVVGTMFNTEDFTEAVFVKSFNVSDPAATFLADEEIFTGDALDAHVSEQAVYVLGDDPAQFDSTIVSYVDISDPAGDIALRDQIRVPGTVLNRFFADEYESTFRIITDEWIEEAWSTVVALYTYDISNPDEIAFQARLPIIDNEDLRSVRFDGDRAYAVTFEWIDPLFVIDLSNPADPRVSGELEVPGYSTHLVPLGDRLVGVGFDDTQGVRPAVALYDVSDVNNPTQLSRIMVGEAYTNNTASEATVDEKALRVVEEAGLILLPFSTFDSSAGRYTDSLQIIGLETNRLTERGVITHRGLVRRADVITQRVWVLSDLAFQTVNVADLSNPVSLATLKLITEQQLLDLGLSNCADSARIRGTPVGLWGGPIWMGGGFGSDPCSLLSLLVLVALFTGLVATRQNGVRAVSRSPRRSASHRR